MSTIIMAQCWPAQTPPTQKSVLISIADQANDQGYCWPSIATICQRTCLSERAVRNAIRWLESVGLLKVEIGAMKANRYTVTPQGYRDPGPKQTAGPPRHVVPPGTTCPPAPDAPQPAPRAGEGGTTCPLTVIEPIPNTPPNPPRGADGALPKAKAKPPAGARQPISFKAWLEQCKAADEKPIPENDPVFRYCEQVGIGRDVLLLHWFVFKARRSEQSKRQKDWRQTFRHSVQSNWYRLWYLRPGVAAELTTQGLQAQALMAAERQAKDEGASDGRT